MHDLATVCMAIESRPTQTNNTPILLQQRRVFSRALHSGLIFLPIKTSEVKYKSEYDVNRLSALKLLELVIKRFL